MSTNQSSLRRYLAWGIVACSVFAAGRVVGWFVSRRTEVGIQVELINRVEELQGQYYYDFELLDDGSLQKGRPPSILGKLLGANWIHDVFYVTFADIDSGEQGRTVAAGRNDVDDSFLELASSAKLKWLALNASAVTDRGISKLAQSLNLEKLWLSQTQVGDDSAQALAACKNLEELALASTQITDSAIESFTRMPNLRTLSIGGNALTEVGLSKLAGLTQIEQLYLDGLPVTDRTLEAFTDFAGLKSVSLRGTLVAGFAPQWASRQEGLAELFLDGTAITSAGWQGVRAPRSLSVLSLSGTQVDSSFLVSLKECSNLESLDLRGTRVRLHHVVESIVEHWDTTPAKALAILKAVDVGDVAEATKVNLAGWQFADEDLRVLEQLPRLQWLYIPGHRLSSEGLSRLSELGGGQLSLLDISYSPIDTTTIERLLNDSQIANLHIVETGIGQNEAERLMTQFPKCRLYTVDFQASQQIKRRN